MREPLLFAGSVALEQQHLHAGAGVLPAMEARRQNARVVHHQQVAGVQEGGEVNEAPVLPAAVRPEVEEPGSVPRLDWGLGDSLGREVVVKEF